MKTTKTQAQVLSALVGDDATLRLEKAADIREVIAALRETRTSFAPIMIAYTG